jgi:23S rRNA pseudouridine2605 synthase
MKERIQKVLAAVGVASRRNIEEMVRQGRIAVNGKTMIDLPILVDPKRDKVTVDEEPVRLASKETSERIYLIMNKPKGVYTTNVAQGVQTRAIDLLPPKFPRVYPVGQLDAESKGLLILTNDGELTNLLTHPRYGVPKTYRAVVDGFIKPQDVQELEKGVWMADKTGKGFKTGRSHIKIATRTRDKSVLEITIREGRNRQIRRMLARIGHKVRDITRTRMGPLTLHGLAVGEFRPLTFRELRELRQAGRPQDPRTRKVPGGKPDAHSEADDE